jgi:hypothetical protein
MTIGRTKPLSDEHLLAGQWRYPEFAYVSRS